jgi:2-polyprenyl-3-methyl-5-hydroxy-6-metoxy-1,4-benzoquinol methylase
MSDIVPNTWPADSLEPVDACPACGESRMRERYADLTDRNYRSPAALWALDECHRCSSLVLRPRPTAESLPLAYRDYYTQAPLPEPSLGGGPTDETRLRRAWRRLYTGYLDAELGYAHAGAWRVGRRVVPLFPRHRAALERTVRHLSLPPDRPRLLDVGCGNGRFLGLAAGIGWDAEGIDPDPNAVAAGQAAGLNVSQGDLSTNRESEPFDAITLSHVIEHVPQPRDELELVFELLRPGGTVWVATPNAVGVGRRLFRRNWFGLDPPRHLAIFSPAALVAAMTRAGFVDVKVRRPELHVFRRYVAPWSSALARGEKPFAAGRPSRLVLTAAVIADRVSFHLPRLADELVVTGRRPS